jgi:hypothetical protein
VSDATPPIAVDVAFQGWRVFVPVSSVVVVVVVVPKEEV